ncbi:MAG: cobalamin-binding protein [Burkholderiaceae bacterium]|nr:MAG: cobalamin-binding protein [Burkholderiaceae bacterium]
MKTRARFLLLAFVLTAGGAQAQIRVVDDRGQALQLAAPAARIVSLAPHLTEMLFAIDAGMRIVGVDEYSDYPPAARSIARIGNARATDIERIRALRPDLVVAWASGNANRQIEKLQALGIPVFVNEPHQMTDIGATLEKLGVLTGTPAQAQTAADAFRAHLVRLQTIYAQRSPVRVFYQVWDHPLMTIGGAQVISDALRLCGAVNVFAHLQTLAPTVEIEAVLAADPDMIVASGEPDNARLQAWQRWPQLQAVRAGNLFMLPPDLLNRMGPRMADGVEQLCMAVDQVRHKKK